MPTPATTQPSSITSRLKSFGAVQAALHVQAGEAVNRLDRRKAAALAGANKSADDSAIRRIEDAGYRQIFAHLTAELEVAKAKMISANSDHLGRLAQVVELQERRDELTRALYRRFVKVRKTYETLYGSHRGFPVLAVSGRTPRHATGLVAQVRETAGFLAKPRVELPPRDVAGITLDPPATAAQLAAGADELDGALVDLDAALKLAEVTRKAKNDALAAYDVTFLRVTRVAERLFQFAGLHQLARRLRPSTRRPGRRLAEESAAPDFRNTASPRATTETSGEPKADAPSVDSGPPPVRPGGRDADRTLDVRQSSIGGEKVYEQLDDPRLVLAQPPRATQRSAGSSPPRVEPSRSASGTGAPLARAP